MGLEKWNYTNYVPGLEEYATDAELSSVELFRDYPVELLKFTSVCCILFMMIGIPGNLITVIALARYKQVRNATAIFIINLSIADLLFCCIILPTVSVNYWTRAWVHGRVFCHVFPLLNYVLIGVSMLTVAAICLNRYILICHPNIYVTLYTRRNVFIMLSSIWAYVVVLLLLPFFELWGRFSLDPHVSACSIVPDHNKNNPKKFIVLFLFSFTCLTMFISYARILLVVRKSLAKRKEPRTERYEMQNINIDSYIPVNAESACTSPESSITFDGTLTTGNGSDNSYIEIDSSTNAENEDYQTRLQWHEAPRKSNKKGRPTKKDKKLRKMVSAIILSFCICYIPITVVKLMYKSFSTNPLTNILGYIMIYFVPCINPIIYVLMSKEYRRAYQSLFRILRPEL